MFVYSGHALSYTSYFTGMPLKLRETNIQMNITGLKIPTGGRQTSWLFTNMTEELNWGPPRKQLQLSGQNGTWTRDLRISSPAP